MLGQLKKNFVVVNVKLIKKFHFFELLTTMSIAKESIRVLLEGGADINLVPDPEKPSAFHILAKEFPGEHELFKLFIEHKGNPNVIHKGKTVLMTLLETLGEQRRNENFVQQVENITEQLGKVIIPSFKDETLRAKDETLRPCSMESKEKTVPLGGDNTVVPTTATSSAEEEKKTPTFTQDVLHLVTNFLGPDVANQMGSQLTKVISSVAEQVAEQVAGQVAGHASQQANQTLVDIGVPNDLIKIVFNNVSDKQNQ